MDDVVQYVRVLVLFIELFLLVGAHYVVIS